jgi:hypothetical protein
MADRDYEYVQGGTGLPALLGYRADPKNRSGRGTGLESVPLKFVGNKSAYKLPEVNPLNVDALRQNMEALRYARELGYPMPPEANDPKFWAGIALEEGRSDFGANGFNTNNKKAIELHDKVSDRFGSMPAAFAAAVFDLGQTASRRKIPFAHAWAGLGTTDQKNDEGEIREGSQYHTGANFPTYLQSFIDAAGHPKNKDFLGFIDQHLNGQDYSTPLPDSIKTQLDMQQDNKAQQLSKDWGPLRQLQKNIFGVDGRFGVPSEKDPNLVPKPDYDQLAKYADPTNHYKRGGSVERTTHDRKLI